MAINRAQALAKDGVVLDDVVANWFFFTDRHKYFRRVYPGALAFSTFRNADGVLESGQYAFWVQWDSKAGGGGWIEPKWFREDVAVPFTIGGTVNIPAGRYDFADLQVVHIMPSGARLRTDVDFRTGTYFDGRRTQAIVSPIWNIKRHLEIGGDYQLSLLRFASRNERANIHLARLRIRTALDARASGNASRDGLPDRLTPLSLSRALVVKYTHTFTF